LGVHYYRHDVALVHARAFGKHGDRCAPGILELLAPVRGGLVLELGCGSGALTRHLLAAGHRVIATDASPDILALAREELGPDADLRRLTLPDDKLPEADAIVSVGHAISYLPDAAAIDKGLVAIAEALRPGGVLAMDVCDLEWGELRAEEETLGRVGPDWAFVTRYSRPSPDKFVRDITAFVPDGQGAWRRDDEHHENVLIDTSRIPALLSAHGVTATLGSAFGEAEMPAGLRTVTGFRS
jgi:SAM-dependent methyltransferase